MTAIVPNDNKLHFWVTCKVHIAKTEYNKEVPGNPIHPCAMKRRFNVHGDRIDEWSPDTPGTRPIDGGFKAWLQEALCHFVTLNTWGYINSFGIF